MAGLRLCRPSTARTDVWLYSWSGFFWPRVRSQCTAAAIRESWRSHNFPTKVEVHVHTSLTLVSSAHLHASRCVGCAHEQTVFQVVTAQQKVNGNGCLHSWKINGQHHCDCCCCCWRCHTICAIFRADGFTDHVLRLLFPIAVSETIISGVWQVESAVLLIITRCAHVELMTKLLDPNKHGFINFIH